MAQNERIAITIDPVIVEELRKLVEERMYPSVSFALESMARASIKEINMTKKRSAVKKQQAQVKRDSKKKKDSKIKDVK